MRFFACSDDPGYGMTRTNRREMAPGEGKIRIGDHYPAIPSRQLSD
jgi:hypothetical protein